MADTPDAIKKSIRIYLFVGGILFLGTILTVMVATVPRMDVGKHGFDKWDCILGLGIAATKATLVAAIFMHLNHERKTVYWLFGSALVMVFWLAVLTGLGMNDPIHDPLFYGIESKTPKILASPTLR